MGDTVFDNDYKYNNKALKAKGAPILSTRHGLAYYKPDLVIVNFGTNDNNAVHTEWTVQDYLFHMKVIATNLQQRFGSAVILSTPHKWNEGTHLKNHWEPEMVDELRTYTERSGFAFSNIFIEYKVGQSDGIHPRDAGHACIANAYKSVLQGKEQSPASKPQISAADLKVAGETVTNSNNGIMMFRAPNSLGSVANQAEALAIIETMNQNKTAGYSDWRLADREELFPLIDQSKRPAIIEDAPFQDLFGFYYIAPTLSWKNKEIPGGIDFTIGIAHDLGNKGHPKVGHVFPVRDSK